MAHILQRLRIEMLSRNLSLYLLPRTDEHQSEYLLPSDERVQYISGFSGSNALALISTNSAYLWTDGRYLLQAEKQLYSGWQLRSMVGKQQKWFQFISKNYQKQSKIGFDPRLIAASNAIDRIKYFKNQGFNFQPVDENLIDIIWQNKPKDEQSPIYLHQQWAGKSMKQKVNWVREKIKDKNGNAAIFNDLSEIAWILNLRSSQIPKSPFFKSILSININGGQLYLPKNHPELQNKIIKSFLQTEGIVVKSYDPIFQQKSLICKNQINYDIFRQIQKKQPIDWDGIGLYRAVRTQKQINGFKRCHIADGVALAKFWAWRSRFFEIDQYQCAQKIDSLRLSQKNNRGISFDTISGGGANAAIIHYRPTPTNSSTIKQNMIHLLDSGGQYLDGTTDVTRTFHFGKPTFQEKESYTQVLLGNLDIQRLYWPANTLTGANIDVLARRHLWKSRKEYHHGTGHGVGYFGGVHEGPVGISHVNNTKLMAGMIVTNQPGYYEAGKYGIRIENMLVVREHEGFNHFEVLTLCPYDKNLIMKELLSESDIQHINKYHLKVRQILMPELADDIQARQWLYKATEPL